MKQSFLRYSTLFVLAAPMCLLLTLSGCSRQDAADTQTMTEQAWQTQKDSIDRLREVPAEKISYKQVAEIDTGFSNPAGIYIGPQNALYAVGDNAIHKLQAGEAPDRVGSFNTTPTCVAIDPEGKIYVGHEESITLFDRDGSAGVTFAAPGSESYITSIAADGETVYVADAAKRAIYRYDTDGQRQAEISADPENGFDGFIVPSPHLDVIRDSDRLIVTNPGGNQVVYFEEGKFTGAWGESGQNLEGFCGCCNPTDIALLPDGRIATAEKGLPRIKVYTASGEFDTVVAAPDSVSRTAEGFDLAADDGGRIYALDRPAKVVRVYEQK